MTILYNVTIVLLCYLIGSIPFGLLIAKALKIGDLRTAGSGNIGATNAWRVGGKKAGILTFACDFLKCFLPVIVVKYHYDSEDAIICGVFIILGHMFPLWLQFKGGKGIASLFGLLLAATPELGLITGLIWGIIFKLYQISSLASLTSMAVMAVLSFFYDSSINYGYLIVFILVCLKHKDNVKRLLNGAEKSVK